MILLLCPPWTKGIGFAFRTRDIMTKGSDHESHFNLPLHIRSVKDLGT